MMKMAFPGTKNMGEALGKMQQMMQGGMGGFGGAGGPMKNRGPRSGPGGGMPQAGQMDAQLKAAMDMLQKMQKGGKR